MDLFDPFLPAAARHDPAPVVAQQPHQVSAGSLRIDISGSGASEPFRRIVDLIGEGGTQHALAQGDLQ